MYVVTVLFEIGEGQSEAFRNAVLQQARNSLEREADCLRFDVCVDPADPRQMFLYEIYTDRSAFDAHLQTAHFRSFDEQVRPWLVSKKVMVRKLLKKEERDEQNQFDV
mgnify:CR=1 FL=1